LPVALAMSSLLFASAFAQVGATRPAASKVTADVGDVAEMSRAEAAAIERAVGRWEDGAERQKLREAGTALAKNVSAAQASLAAASETMEALIQSVDQSGVAPKLARIEDAVKEAGDRIRARWQQQQAALDRERVRREREAAERARSRP